MDRIGDHRAVEHIVDGAGLAVEDGIRIGASAGALVRRDLGQGPRVVTVAGAVKVGDLGIAAVLCQVAVGDVELGLG